MSPSRSSTASWVLVDALEGTAARNIPKAWSVSSSNAPPCGSPIATCPLQWSNRPQRSDCHESRISEARQASVSNHFRKASWSTDLSSVNPLNGGMAMVREFLVRRTRCRTVSTRPIKPFLTPFDTGDPDVTARLKPLNFNEVERIPRFEITTLSRLTTSCTHSKLRGGGFIPLKKTTRVVVKLLFVSPTVRSPRN